MSDVCIHCNTKDGSAEIAKLRAELAEWEKSRDEFLAEHDENVRLHTELEEAREHIAAADAIIIVPLRAERDQLINTLQCKGEYIHTLETDIGVARAQRDQLAAEAAKWKEMAEWQGACTKAALERGDRLRAAIESALDRRYLRDVSHLASNPPQNAAVWDMQSKLRAALEGSK